MSYLEIVLSAVFSAIGIVAQTVAARRTETRTRLDPGLLARLASDRLYLVGFAAQVLAFVLAFLARAELPLFLVQAGSTAAVGLAAVLGALLLGWRMSRRDIAAVVGMACGLMLLVSAAVPSSSAPLHPRLGFGLLAVTVGTLVVAMFCLRLHGPRAAVVLGVLAGLDFAVLAVASRPLAGGPLPDLLAQPAAWLMFLAALTGQFLMATALQRGSATMVMAAMDSTATVLASVVGLVFLGDLVVAGREAWVTAGLALIVLGVIAMALNAGRAERTSRGPTDPENATKAVAG